MSVSGKWFLHGSWMDWKESVDHSQKPSLPLPQVWIGSSSISTTASEKKCIQRPQTGNIESMSGLLAKGIGVTRPQPPEARAVSQDGRRWDPFCHRRILLRNVVETQSQRLSSPQSPTTTPQTVTGAKLSCILGQRLTVSSASLGLRSGAQRKTESLLNQVREEETLARGIFERREQDAWLRLKLQTISPLQQHHNRLRKPSRERSKGNQIVAPDVKSSAQAMYTMLQLAAVRPGEVVYDIGCGDGELLYTLALETDHTVQGIGIEIRRNKVKEARQKLERFGTRMTIIEADALELSYADADVVVMYLVPKALRAIGRRLKRDCRPGTRVISQLFPIPGWESESPSPNGMFFYVIGQNRHHPPPSSLFPREGRLSRTHSRGAVT